MLASNVRVWPATRPTKMPYTSKDRENSKFLIRCAVTIKGCLDVSDASRSDEKVSLNLQETTRRRLEKWIFAKHVKTGIDETIRMATLSTHGEDPQKCF